MQPVVIPLSSMIEIYNLINVYDKKCTFNVENGGRFFPGFKKNPSQYLQECSSGVKQWLLDLKQDNKVVFLMTSSAADFASLVLNTVFG